MTLVRVNGVSLHTRVLVPDGVAEPRTAVLIHDLATDTMASWYFTLAYPLVQSGFRVVLPDLRGHGRSERPPLRYALNDFVDDLDVLLRDEAPALLLGDAFGGTIAYAYAARHPGRVAGIVAVESSPPTPAWFAQICRRLENLGSRQPAMAGAHRADPRVQETIRLLAETSLREELPASALPSRDRLAAITCPVLSLYGDRSPAVRFAAGTTRLLPHAVTRTLAGDSLLIDQPDDVRAAVTAWLHTAL